MPGVVVVTSTSRSGSATGSLRRIRLSIREKMAVFAPMPRAIERVATMVTTGAAPSARNPILRSRQNPSTTGSSRGHLIEVEDGC